MPGRATWSWPPVSSIAGSRPARQHANRLTIHILAAVAEDEARRISERTKAALAAARRRGTKLGAVNPSCRNLTNAARRRGAQAAGAAVKQQADEAYADLADFLAELRPALSYQQIADVLNLKGQRTRRGKVLRYDPHEWLRTNEMQHPNADHRDGKHPERNELVCWHERLLPKAPLAGS